MSFQEKTLTCCDCAVTFPFTVAEQEFFATKGFTNEPKRCPSCRQARKTERNGGGNSSYGYNRPQRQMFPATCGQCGKETQVPFQPRGDKPVYCSDCYSKIKVTK